MDIKEYLNIKMCRPKTKQRDTSVKIPQGNSCHSPKGLNCKELNEGTICAGVVRIKRINKGCCVTLGRATGAGMMKEGNNGTSCE